MTERLVAFTSRFGDVTDRSEATATIETIAEQRPGTVEDAIEAVATDVTSPTIDRERRVVAAKTLSEVSPIVPERVRERGWHLLPGLDDEDTRPYVASALTTALQARGRIEPLLDRLVDEVAPDNPRQAAQYLFWLSKRHGRRLAAVEDTLVDWVTNGDDATRGYAARTLAIIPPYRLDGTDAMAPLYSLVDATEPESRAAALTALGRLAFRHVQDGRTVPDDASVVVEAAADHLTDPVGRVRFNAAAVLAEADYYHEDAGDRDWTDHVDESLERRVVTRLVDLLDEHPTHARMAANALWNHRHACVDALAEHVDAIFEYGWNDDQPGRDRISGCLRVAAESNPEAIVDRAETIVERVSTDPTDAHSVAIVDEFAMEDLDAIHHVILLLVDRLAAMETRYRKQMALTLAAIATESPDAVPDVVLPIVEAVDDPNVETAINARWEPLAFVAVEYPDVAGRYAFSICDRLDEPDASDQRRLLSTLADVDPRAAESAIESLVEHVSAGDSAALARSVRTAGGLRDEHRKLLAPVAAPLTGRLNDLELPDRFRAYTILKAIAEDEPDVLVESVDKITAKLVADEDCREGAGDVLRALGRTSPDVVHEAVQPFLPDDANSSAVEETIDLLVDTLDDRDDDDSTSASEAETGNGTDR